MCLCRCKQVSGRCGSQPAKISTRLPGQRPRWPPAAEVAGGSQAWPYCDLGAMCGLLNFLIRPAKLKEIVRRESNSQKSCIFSFFHDDLTPRGLQKQITCCYTFTDIESHYVFSFLSLRLVTKNTSSMVVAYQSKNFFCTLIHADTGRAHKLTKRKQWR